MEQYHRVYASINLENIRHNIREIQNRVGIGVKLMPVIKADAYGHGAPEVAAALKNYADAFAVATIEEAMQIRRCAPSTPILILGTLSCENYDKALKYDITVALYTYEMAVSLSESAKRFGKNAAAHLALNTGMNRIGMPCTDEGIELAKRICSLDNLDVSGIFSHYATADEADKQYSHLQLDRFDAFCNRLEADGIKLDTKHICNSAAIIDLPEKKYDMVRPGIITYGLNPSDEINKNVLNLKPALEFKSHISFIKTLPAGESISYGRTYTTDRECRIATVPVGYADGYPRLLSNKGRVLIHGKSAPIVGRVCMDQFMVDISHIPEACIEDDVTLIGEDNGAFISADEIAEKAGTINYEIVCGLSKRVPRIYK